MIASRGSTNDLDDALFRAERYGEPIPGERPACRSGACNQAVDLYAADRISFEDYRRGLCVAHRTVVDAARAGGRR